MKKFLLLFAVLFFLSPLTVLASPNIESPLALHGHITDVDDDYVVVTDDQQNSVQVNISWDTLIVSGKSGRDIPLDRLNKGDAVSAYYSQIMTRSLPPQAHGYALVMTPADNNGATYAVVTEAQKTKTGVCFLDKTSNNYITLPKADFPALQDIQNGDTLLVWYNAVALSNPGQTTAVKAVRAEY